MSARPRFGEALEEKMSAPDTSVQTGEHIESGLGPSQSFSISVGGGVDSDVRRTLRSYSVKRLQQVKRLCDKFIADHRIAPPPEECGQRYTEYVLCSVAVKNKRFQLELRRSAAKDGRIYINGPYLYAYYRAGRIVKSVYHGKRPWHGVPRKVKTAMSEHVESAAVQHAYAEVTKKYEKSGNEGV